jgi:hypothetical protein
VTYVIPDGVLPGTIGLVNISGEVGKLIHLGQWLNSHPIDRWLSPEDYPNIEHSFVLLPDRMLIEAEPGGARIVSIDEYTNVDVFWCTSIAAQLTTAELADVAAAAATFKGRPYSFLDYVELFARRLHLPVWLLRWRIAALKHVICSQLAALAYHIAGHNLFPGTWRDLVAPYDLWALEMSLRS